MEVLCWECHFLGYLAPVEGAAEVMEKFPQAVFISSGHCHVVTPQPLVCPSFAHIDSLISSDKALSILSFSLAV